MVAGEVLVMVILAARACVDRFRAEHALESEATIIADRLVALEKDSRRKYPPILGATKTPSSLSKLPYYNELFGAGRQFMLSLPAEEAAKVDWALVGAATMFSTTGDVPSRYIWRLQLLEDCRGTAGIKVELKELMGHFMVAGKGDISSGHAPRFSDYKQVRVPFLLFLCIFFYSF
jgi:hypothetical protein